MSAFARTDDERRTEGRVRRALYQRIEGDGYLKAKTLTAATGLSAAAIGQALGRMADRERGPHIEAWGGHNASRIWHIHTGGNGDGD